MSISIDGKTLLSLHFIGILGSGMSAVAAYCRGEGIIVSGSDRLSESIDTKEMKEKLTRLGCALFSQDGSGIVETLSAVVVSTAIEETNPDIIAARACRLPVLHRSDVLAAIVETKKTVAIAGTSGKSTVVAMVFEMLCGCGKEPSLITGADLICLEEKGLIGNSFHATGERLIIEADESDGSLVKYRPDVSVFLNVSKDHKPVDEINRLFAILAGRSKRVIINADDSGLVRPTASMSFGTTERADFRPDRIDALTPAVVFRRGSVRFELPVPGAHNCANALAALYVCNFLGCDDATCAETLKRFKGVKRRFSIMRLTNGITIIDDFAHNPEKIRAALVTAKALCRRVFAVFQPHGFGPVRFFKDDLIDVFATTLTKEDRLLMLPIYYAGGTARKDVSSDELAALVRGRSRSADAPADRSECLSILKAAVIPGDAVLLMGARDPSLGSFARQIAERLR